MTGADEGFDSFFWQAVIKTPATKMSDRIFLEFMVAENLMQKEGKNDFKTS